MGTLRISDADPDYERIQKQRDQRRSEFIGGVLVISLFPLLGLALWSGSKVIEFISYTAIVLFWVLGAYHWGRALYLGYVYKK